MKKVLAQQKRICYNNLTKFYGGVAQLGERHTGSVEVIGSIPTVSTIIIKKDCE